MVGVRRGGMDAIWAIERIAIVAVLESLQKVLAMPLGVRSVGQLALHHHHHHNPAVVTTFGASK
jgi:hypothetical protein